MPRASTTRDSSASTSGRGTGWVLVQLALFAAIVVSCFLGPRVTRLGFIPAAVGLALVVWAQRTMGPSFSPFPKPPPHGTLVTSGPFRFLRHPIYVGGLLFFAGISLVFSAYGIVLTGVLAVFWLAKARLEERHLAQRFPEYEDYRSGTWF